MSVSEINRKFIEDLCEEPVDDRDYKSLKEFVEKELSTFFSDYSSCILAIEGIPVVETSKKEKLIGTLVKKFTCPEGSKVVDATKFKLTNESIFLPEGPNNILKGFCFVIFENKNEAEKAARLIDGRHLDSKHSFRCMILSQMDMYMKIQDDFLPPKEEEYKESLYHQLSIPEKKSLGQFVYYHNKKTTIMKRNASVHQLCIERERWTENSLTWSPRGTYLATSHAMGIAFWGGKDWIKVQKFEHIGVSTVLFSPCEKYLATCNEPSSGFHKHPSTVSVWDILTGMKMRSFPYENNMKNWENFSWSYDDNYLARGFSDYITVYEASSMKTLVEGERKTIPLSTLTNFLWSPSNNFLIYWIPEKLDSPARIVIVDIPSKKELRSKNLFSVTHVTFYWQSKGDYVCAKVDSKKGKRETTSLEIFYTSKKNIPVESLSLSEKTYNFAWEPNGNIFAIVHGDSTSTKMSIYNVQDKEKNRSEIIRIGMTTQISFRTIDWSPSGNLFLLSNLSDRNSYTFELWESSSFSCIATCDHYLVTNLSWDPTGRYFASFISDYNETSKQEFIIWSCQGRQLFSASIDQLHQFLWRPLPKCEFTSEEIQKIKKNTQSYAEFFDKEDKEASSKVTKKEIERHEEQRHSWDLHFKKIQVIKKKLMESMPEKKQKCKYDEILIEESVMIMNK